MTPLPSQRINRVKYSFNVVFLFHSFLVLTVGHKMQRTTDYRTLRKQIKVLYEVKDNLGQQTTIDNILKDLTTYIGPYRPIVQQIEGHLDNIYMSNVHRSKGQV